MKAHKTFTIFKQKHVHHYCDISPEFRLSALQTTVVVEGVRAAATRQLTLSLEVSGPEVLSPRLAGHTERQQG